MSHRQEFYFESDPEVLARLDVIDQKLDLLKENVMSQADDLNNLGTSLATGYSALHDAVMVEMDALTAAMGKVAQPDPAVAKAITDVIANVTAITGKMATDAAALTKSVPAASTVPPPVVVPPATPPTVTPPVIATPPVTDPAATPPSTPPASATTT
jgi:hypothetical protein